MSDSRDSGAHRGTGERSCTWLLVVLLNRRVSGPLAPYADGFRAALDARGFSPWSQMFYLYLLADVSRWLGRTGWTRPG